MLVLNGVNLGALGTRRPVVYGTLTLGDIEEILCERFPGVDSEFRQTDFKGVMVGFVREGRGSDGIVINPGAWTYSPVMGGWSAGKRRSGITMVVEKPA